MEPKMMDKGSESRQSMSVDRDRRQAHGAAALLDRALPAGYLREWTERISSPIEAPDSGTQSALVFRIGGERLALPTRALREIAEDCTFHTLPRRADHIAAGLVNVRSEILICISLENLLGLERESRTEERKDHPASNRAVVVEQGSDRFAFPVSDVCAVVRYHPRELKDVPATLARSSAAYTIGMLSWQAWTVGCLDDELVFAAIHRGLA